MTDKFKVTPLQQGRFIAIKGPNLNVELTRSEATELHNAIHFALLEDARVRDGRT